MKRFLLLFLLLPACGGKETIVEPSSFLTPPPSSSSPPSFSEEQLAQEQGSKLSFWNEKEPVPPISARVCPVGSSFRFRLDNRYPALDRAFLQASWEEWQQLLGSRITIIWETADPMSLSFEPCTVSFLDARPPSGYLGWTTSWTLPNKKATTARVFILQGMGDRLHQIALHEMGHFLGLSHSEDKKSVMHPGSYPDSGITCLDKKNLCAIWGCDSGCP